MQILSETECVEIVRNFLKLGENEDVDLKSYEIKGVSDGLHGFMGEYFRLRIVLEDKIIKDDIRELFFFVKSIPTQNELHKDECLRKGFFRKEERIYVDILPNIQRYAPSKLFPECYYTRADLIVLEDLAFKNFGHQEGGFTEEHHKLVLCHQAKMHAASIAWELDELFNIGEVFKDTLFEMQLTMNNEWYVTGIKGLIFLAKMHPNFQTPDSQMFINNELFDILANMEKLTKPSNKFRNVLCHRDSWERNIFFQKDTQGKPVDCRFVDFQLTRYCPPGMDVLFFIYVTNTKEQREKIYNIYLDYYYNALQREFESLGICGQLITKSDFLKGCESARLAVITLWAICEPLIRMPPWLANKMRNEEQEKFDFYMNHERSELFLRLMDMDSGYKNIIMTPVEELLNYLKKNPKYSCTL